MSTPLNEKYTLSIKESAQYFGIGMKRLRRLAEEHMDTFAIRCGNKYLIIRTEFEAFLKDSEEI